MVDALRRKFPKLPTRSSYGAQQSTVRYSAEEGAEIEYLEARWYCTKSQAIRRAIHEAYQRELRGKR